MNEDLKPCPFCGTLTAEQVMAIAGKHQTDYCSDTHVCFDWQAIADELNAWYVNSEPIVRCRDCIFAKPDQSDHEYRGEYRCNMWVADIGADEFCSRGRSKELGEVGKIPYGDNERKFPTADGNRELVRCRDCRFSLAHGNGCGRNQDIYDAEPNGFCAWGEWRDV